MGGRSARTGGGGQMSFANPYGAVFDQLLGFCSRPPPFGPPWDFIQPPSDTFGPVADPPAALTALLDRFPTRRLRTAGVVHTRADGSHVLAPPLLDPGGVFVPLRADPTAAPFAVLTAHGSLPVRAAALAAALADVRTAAL